MNRSVNPPLRRAFLLSGLVVGLLSAPAMAFKWHTCPVPPLPVYPSSLGATSSPFVHPGHPLTVVLNSKEVQTGGGYSLRPQDNRVVVTFGLATAGTAVALPAIHATATSASSLTFSFPDTLQQIGRQLAGPVRVEVFVNRQRKAFIQHTDLVALPPANDAEAILWQGFPALAAYSTPSDLWIPVHFEGDHMPMPGCEGDFVQPLPVYVERAYNLSSVRESDLMENVSSIEGYLGDMSINGVNFYGWRMSQVLFTNPLPLSSRAVLDRMNDAKDLVIHITLRDASLASRLGGVNSKSLSGSTTPDLSSPLEIFLMGE